MLVRRGNSSGIARIQYVWRDRRGSSMNSSCPQRNQKRKTGASLRPVVQVRRIPDLTRLLLFVRAGGRCEFDGCPRYLMEHPVTLTEGNLAQVAHVVAFRRD